MNRRDLFKGVFGAAIASAIPLPVVVKRVTARTATFLTPAMISREAARILNQELMVKRAKAK